MQAIRFLDRCSTAADLHLNLPFTMAARALISISDFHLGRGNPQDSFFTAAAAHVRAFGERLAGRPAGIDLTVLLNGDIFDLWELVPDDQLVGGWDAYKAITTGLLVPTRDRRSLDLLVAQVRERVAMALHAHPEVVYALGEIAASGAHIHFNVGNHDHAFDNTVVGAVLREALGLAAAGDRFTMGRFYQDPVLGFYAEHGDQFASDGSRSPLLDAGGVVLKEGSGFYFLRYVWNRMEMLGQPQISSLRQALDSLASIMSHGHYEILTKAKAYLHDYFTASDRTHFELVPNPIVQKLYQVWRDNQYHFLNAEGPALWAGEDPVIANVPGLGPGLGNIDLLQARPPQMDPPNWMPGAPSPIGGGATRDEYSTGLSGRFHAQSPWFPLLDTQTTRVVSLGHTHVPLIAHLPEGPLYYNSGSWTAPPYGGGLHFVWVVGDENGALSGLSRADA